ncbi:caspase domain-containing protein [Vibrio splendidus]|uniref:caspase family protein n=1 Tax=Vibrio TaxID=662 RepID=UPI000C82D9C7|nr:caspase family protein [Vibrio splendidus]PMO91672.1 peptidase C14 [Vibrio splendidus]PMP22934.1 peptidase C14 [Vibrio splendidus]PMP35376.1 peptidase C14 [Vibrio splendidus]PMP46415.1 peptidase C14 [Vibrio splendidus]PMP47102.1 peptidase C14 [Vibrio splendidus]
MKKALVVGIDYYDECDPLYGCVNDSFGVKTVLERHGDGSINFGVKHLTATGSQTSVNRKQLKEAAKDLFEDASDVALFYFAGHGHIESTGGYLVTSECTTFDDGFPLSELLTIANDSPARNRIIVLDSCFSGVAGTVPNSTTVSLLSEGVTILTASSAHQYADEVNGHGVFTNLFIDALSGSAANLVGDVTPGSIYAHIDQSLGPWDQRPIFKTNVKSFTTLRKCQAPISLDDLRSLPDFFLDAGSSFALDPSFEPDSPLADETNTKLFATLQRLVKVNLVVPEGEDHMYYAAINSKSCRLTVLGAHYWKLASNQQI